MTMKRIDEIVNQYKSSGVTVVEQKKAIELSENDKKTVNSVLERLQISFPAWRVAFPTERAWMLAKQEWMMALVNAGCVTEEMLSLGFKKARESDTPYFPSPGMFIKWCQLSPESFGMPTLEQALYEVSRHKASHPAVTLAAKATRFERETLSASEYKPVFERAYDLLVGRVMRGEDLGAEILKALPTQDQIKHSPEFYQETGQRGVSSLKALFKRKNQV